MNIKNKIKKWVISIVDSRIEDRVGKESNSNFFGYIPSSWFLNYTQDDDRNGNTGVFKKIERLEEKINALEKYLKIYYHTETKEIKSYHAEKEEVRKEIKKNTTR